MKLALSCLLLGIVFSPMVRADAPATQPAAPSTRPADMPADQLLQQMLRPSNGPVVQPLRPILNPPVMDQTTGKMVVPNSALPQNLKREGDYVNDRMGRLTRSADGQTMEFTFESDGRTMQDPPVIILPNLKLMSMEDAVNGSNRDLRFRVTGQVTEYKGRNYILLEKVSVVQEPVQQFWRMSFATPLWLLLLIPWIALLVWLLIGQRQRVAVPFLELWSGPVGAANVKRRIQPPPMALACALAGILMGMLGAATPVLRWHGARDSVTLIVDRGITMPTARREQPAGSIDHLTPSRVVIVPPWNGLSTDGANWKSAPDSAMTTQDLLQSAIGDALSTNSPVIVLSDQTLNRNDRRIIQITPTTVPQNVGIVSLSISTSLAPQVMVRVRNQSSLKSCDLVVTSSGKTIRKPISLPAMEGEINAFVDLPTPGNTIEAKLEAADDLAVDNTGWLVRQRSWPRIEVRGTVPAELRRMIKVYQSHRPSSEKSARVAIVDSLFALPASDPAVGVLRDRTNAKPISDRVGVEFGDHPVIAGVDWRTLVADTIAAENPGEGWTTLVRCGAQVLVAVRVEPARQVWVGFNSPSFAKEKDYVIFWTNVFDWVGQGGEEFAQEPMQSIASEWKLKTTPIPGIDLSPGIYQRSDQAIRALNAIDVRFSKLPQADGRRQLSAIAPSTLNGTNLAPGLLIFAMLLTLAAAGLWNSRSA